MRHQAILYTLCCITLFYASFASANTPLYFGHSDTLYSKILEEDRLLSIKLPEGYKKNKDKTYPVLYTLDGQTHFRRVAGTLEWLSDTSQTIPQHIVVAIHGNGEQRGRDTNVVLRDGKISATNHLVFLSKELIPYIDKTYRTSPYRILAGHSAQARFALFAYAQTESPFDAFIAMSPALPKKDHDLAGFVNGLAKHIKTGQTSSSYLFMTLGNEPDNQASFDRLSKSLTKAIKHNSAWEVQSYPQETHMSVPSKTLHNAMLAIAIHEGWTAPTKVMAKGPNAVIKHYKQVSKRLGRTIRPNVSIFFSMGWDALNGGSYDKAEKIFKAAMKLYPKNEYLHESLATNYRVSNQPAKAIASLTTAIALAKAANNADGLNWFKERKARLVHDTSTSN